MTRFVLLALLGVVTLSSSSTAFADCERMYTYSYSGRPDADNFELFVPPPGQRWGTIHFASDVLTTGIEFCGVDSEYFCFLPYFAVPKRFDGSVRKWTLNDRTFEVVRDSVAVQILGRRFEGLFEIKAPPTHKDDPPDATMVFLFSPRLGLIGFTTHGRTARWATAWLMEEHGFGASPPGPPSFLTRYRGEDSCPAINPNAVPKSPPAESRDRSKE